MIRFKVVRRAGFLYQRRFNAEVVSQGESEAESGSEAVSGSGSEVGSEEDDSDYDSEYGSEYDSELDTGTEESSEFDSDLVASGASTEETDFTDEGSSDSTYETKESPEKSGEEGLSEDEIVKNIDNEFDPLYDSYEETKVSVDRGLNYLHTNLFDRHVKKNELDKILEKDATEDYALFDSKYNKEKMTRKSATYMDIIRHAPKSDVDIPIDIDVESTNEFNRTLIRLFEVGQLKKAREYFFRVKRRSDSPIRRSSYNIAIAEMVNSGEVALAQVFLNLLKETNEGPDIKSYNSMISACVRYTSVVGARNILAEMKSRNIEPNQDTKEYLIALNLKDGNIDIALELYDEIGRNNASDYIPWLFARAYGKIHDFEKVNEYAWGENSIQSNFCEPIVNDMIERGFVKELESFLNEMEKRKLTLSWTTAQKAVAAYKDGRNEYPLTLGIKSTIAHVASEPTSEERINMIRKATIEEREQNVVFKKHTRKAPIWKRKVELKNPADAAWDTLIQEYLAIAYREQKLRSSVAKKYRASKDASRKIDPVVTSWKK